MIPVTHGRSSGRRLSGAGGQARLEEPLRRSEARVLQGIRQERRAEPIQIVELKWQARRDRTPHPWILVRWTDLV